jgi:tetratricopeptide (TPR) repeat protein
VSGLKKDWDIVDFAAKASKFVELHFKKTLAVFALIIIASSLWAYKKSADRQRESAAFANLYEVTKEYNKLKDQFAQALDDQQKNPEDPTPPPQDPNAPKPDPATGDLDKDYGSIVQKLHSFLDSHKGSNASLEAALVLSEIYEEYARPEKGAEVLSSALTHASQSTNVLTGVVKMRAGDLWATAKNCDAAIPFWEPLAQGKGFMVAPAQLKMGVCLQELGRLDEAKNWFQKLIANSPDSVEGFNAKRYLRFIDFKNRSGEDKSTKNRAQKKDSKDQKSS